MFMNMLRTCGLVLLILLPCLSRAAETEDPCKKYDTIPATKPEKGKKPDKNAGQLVPLTLVVCEVEQALNAYQQDPDVQAAKIPKLATADFDFKTTTDIKGGISVSFLVFSIKYTHDNQTVHDVDFQYAPQEIVGFDQQRADFQKELINTIKAAAKAIKENQDAMMTSENPLVFKQLTVTISFGVTHDLQVGATIPIHLVTLGPSFEGSKNSVQQVKLVFGKPKPAKDAKTEGN
jgi:hypothetical protein